MIYLLVYGVVAFVMMGAMVREVDRYGDEFPILAIAWPLLFPLMVGFWLSDKFVNRK